LSPPPSASPSNSSICVSGRQCSNGTWGHQRRGHERRHRTLHTTVPNWRYRDLQQEPAAGLAVGCVFPLGGAAAVAAASVIVFLPGCPRCGVPWSTGRMLLICAPIIGGAQSWICRRRIVIRWALPNKQLARSPSIAEPSVVQADDDASHGPASSLARRAYFSLVSLRCLFAVLQPACFSSPGLSESMRAP
jgi:hypothetical protein